MSALLSVEKVTWRGVLGTILGWVVRLWVRTLFVVIEGEPPSRGVSAFLHGQQMALLSARRPTGAAVLVSRSRDGEIQAAAMSVLGFRVVRGSSTKGGARGLVRLLRLARAGFEVALAVDGPRGPVSVPKPGAGLLAARAKVPLIAVASASRRKIVLRRSWDSFEIPLPFSRVAVVFGTPVLAAPGADGRDALASALVSARARAEQLVAVRGKAYEMENEGPPCRSESR